MAVWFVFPPVIVPETSIFLATCHPLASGKWLAIIPLPGTVSSVYLLEIIE
jgi:hypothetical protein